MSGDIDLKTDRLTLRPLEMSDAPRIASLACAREIAENTLTIPHPYTLDDAVDFIQFSRRRWQAGELFTFFITLNIPDEYGIHNGIGCIGISKHARHKHGELGYWIGKDYWGQGYATEAARRMIQFAFDDLDLYRVYAFYFKRNPASARVMEKAGMQYEGTMRQHYERWGEYLDVGYYGILRADIKA